MRANVPNEVFNDMLDSGTVCWTITKSRQEDNFPKIVSMHGSYTERKFERSTDFCIFIVNLYMK